MAGFVSGGLITLRKALSIVGWANLGTVLLVFIAAIDIKIAALYMIGISALAVTFNLAEKQRAFLQALYSVGLLFFGLRTMREAFQFLPDFDWFASAIAIVQGSSVVAFALGACLHFLIQSSAAIVVLCITFWQSGVLSETQTIFMILGTGLGVALAGFALSVHLRGVPRQIVLFQIANNTLASLTALLLMLVPLENHELGVFSILFEIVPGPPTTHMALSYLLLNSLGLVWSLATASFAPRILARLSPATEEEDTVTPQFLLDEALTDPETAVQLIEQEQQRFLSKIPLLLPSSRAAFSNKAASDHTLDKEPLILLGREIRAYMADLLNQGLLPELAERLLHLERRQNILDALVDNVGRMSLEAATLRDHPALAELRLTLVESLDGVFLVALDTFNSLQSTDIEILLAMTSDRGDMMRAARSSLLAGGTELAPEQRNSLYQFTSLFERLIWLLNQLAHDFATESKSLEMGPQANVRKGCAHLDCFKKRPDERFDELSRLGDARLARLVECNHLG